VPDELFRHLLEALPDGVVVINEQGRIVLVNRQVEQLFGYTRKELLGQAIEILVPERLRQEHEGNRLEYFVKPEIVPLGERTDALYGEKGSAPSSVDISLSPLPPARGCATAEATSCCAAARRRFKTLVEKSR
jgi:PAS domain S-box-containing protein